MDKNNINIGTFNFVNCLPINYSLAKWDIKEITLISNYPAKINQLMASHQLHISPVSSAHYLDNLDKYSLIDTICISSDNEVGSVTLFSNYRLEELENKTIGTPYTSFSSINLLKILLKEKGLNLEKIRFEPHKYELTLEESLNYKYDAILYIGDPALIANYNKSNLADINLQSNNDKNNLINGVCCRGGAPTQQLFPLLGEGVRGRGKNNHLITNQYEILIYDLGKLWKDLTNYPMVFATWVARSDWKASNENDFEWVSLLLAKAVKAGLNIYLEKIINLASENLNLDKMYLRDYFTHKINYKFTQKHKESLDIFKELYSKLKV